MLDDGGTLDWNVSWPVDLTMNGVNEDCFFGARTRIDDTHCGGGSGFKILCEFVCNAGAF